jgi:hypothetical protein
MTKELSIGRSKLRNLMKALVNEVPRLRAETILGQIRWFPVDNGLD